MKLFGQRYGLVKNVFMIIIALAYVSGTPEAITWSSREGGGRQGPERYGGSAMQRRWQENSSRVETLKQGRRENQEETWRGVEMQRRATWRDTWRRDRRKTQKRDIRKRYGEQR